MLPDDPRYPIGKFHHDGPVTDADLARWTGEIAALPGDLRRAVSPLDDARLDTPYRPGGWTIRQVVHHVPESHMNAYIRFMWALTEDEPLIKPYDEARRAAQADYRLPVEPSLALLERLHERWLVLIRSLDRAQLSRRFVHPEWGAQELARTVGHYAWHGRHHLAHVTTAIAGW